MVSDADRSTTPRYDLSRIRELAAQDAVDFAGPKVGSDLIRLDFSLTDLCDCLGKLAAGDFQESLTYYDSGLCYDVYYMTVKVDSNRICELYIKLKLNKSGTRILVGSFHEQNSK